MLYSGKETKKGALCCPSILTQEQFLWTGFNIVSGFSCH